MALSVARFAMMWNLTICIASAVAFSLWYSDALLKEDALDRVEAFIVKDTVLRYVAGSSQFVIDADEHFRHVCVDSWLHGTE